MAQDGSLPGARQPTDQRTGHSCTSLGAVLGGFRAGSRSNDAGLHLSELLGFCKPDALYSSTRRAAPALTCMLYFHLSDLR